MKYAIHRYIATLAVPTLALVTAASATERVNPNAPTDSAPVSSAAVAAPESAVAPVTTTTTTSASSATTVAPTAATAATENGTQTATVPPTAPATASDSAASTPTAAKTLDSTSSLENQLAELQTPTRPPAGVTREKMYVVQSRYNPLAKRFGFDLGASRNFSGSSYLNMTQMNLDLRYHLSDRWDLALGGSYGFNSFTSDADRLMAEQGMLPDTAYVKNRAHLLIGYNVFYGKFRLGMDNTFYFDQYVAVGPGIVTTQFGSASAGVADVGFVFWAGRHGNVRLGVQNEFFNEKRLKSSSFERHTLAHLDIGYTFGGSKEIEYQ